MLTISHKNLKQLLTRPEVIQRAQRIAQMIAIVFCLGTLQACQGIKNNETSFNYRWNQEVFNEVTPKRIIIAHANLGAPSRTYLQKYEAKIDNAVKDRLSEGQFDVVDSQVFKSIWRGAVRKHGEPYDLETGLRKKLVLEAILFDVIEAVNEQNLADAVLFTDLLERNVFLPGRSDRKAQWDGVSRSPRLSAPGGIPEDFNWSQPITAASLMVVLYSSDQRFLFQSAGGLELTREIDIRSKGRLVRRKNLFSNNAQIKEGVAIALHPLVKLEGYVEHKK